MTQKTIDLLGPIIEDVTPCLGLSLQANGLEHDHSATNHSITKLFAQQQQQKQQEDHHVPYLSSNHCETSHIDSDNDTVTKKQQQQQKLSFPSVQSPLPTETTTNTVAQQKSKKLGILGFYGKNQVDEEEDNDKTWKCDKCFKRIPRDQIEEHTDYHFALDLQNAERNNNNNDNNNNNNKSPNDNNGSRKRGSSLLSSSTPISTENDLITEQEKKKKKLFFFQQPRK